MFGSGGRSRMVYVLCVAGLMLVLCTMYCMFDTCGGGCLYRGVLISIVMLARLWPGGKRWPRGDPEITRPERVCAAKMRPRRARAAGVQGRRRNKAYYYSIDRGLVEFRELWDRYLEWCAN